MSNEPEDKDLIQRAEKPEFLSGSRFDEFDLQPQILKGLKDAGFTYCTPIQADVLPVSLTGKDIAGQAQTGTGKTAAFMVTIFSRILSDPDRKKNKPSALIVAPTRELALQIYEDSIIIGRHTGLKLAQVVGGIDYKKQADILRKGTDIVICTPGRIIDYIKQGIFDTSAIKIMTIDEADRLFDLGFTKDMRYILKKLPHYEKRQSMLFSATLSHRVLALTYDYMNLPEFISVTPKEITAEGVDQTLFHVGKNEKLPLLLGLLEREEWNRIMIFVNTKSGVEWLAKKLKGNGLPAEGITGDLPQPKRLKLMERFKDGRKMILVATDVASRGIHVDDISHAINYDLPQDAENYIHRIGRTARAGRKGHAISLACEGFVFHLEAIEELLGYKIPVVWAENEWFSEDKAGHVSTEKARTKKRPASSKSKPPARAKSKTPASAKSAQAAKIKRAELIARSKKIATSSEPGGIFGLAPGLKTQAETETEPKPETPQAQKPKRKRRRRKPIKKTDSTKTGEAIKTEKTTATQENKTETPEKS